MKTNIKLLSIIFLLSVSTVYASNDNKKMWLEPLNEIENTLAKEDERLNDKIAQLEKRMSKFSSNIAAIQAAKEDIEEKYKDILKKEATFASVQKSINDNKLSIAEIKTNANNLRSDQIRIEGNIDSSQKIITWVTLIVSVVVVLIGAFFSKSFLELYSNYRVVCARYPEVKQPEQDNEA